MGLRSKQRYQAEQVTARAFTLLEVLLAIVISIGMMGVVLYFYQQSVSLRKNALEAMEELTTVRLVMDRLGTELRCVANGTELLPGLVGTATSIEFVRLEPPVKGAIVSSTEGETNGFVLLGGKQKMQPTLRKVTYRLVAGDGGKSALERLEEAYTVGVDGKLVAGNVSEGVSTNSGTVSTNDVAGDDLESLGIADVEDDGNEVGTMENGGTNSFVAGLSYDNGGTNGQSAIVYAGDILNDTNAVESEGFMAMEGFVGDATNVTQRVIPLSAVFAKGIGFFHLRYYDGKQWVESWNDKKLPQGVEIVMAVENPETEEARALREMEAEMGEVGSAMGETMELKGESWESDDSMATNDEAEVLPLQSGDDEEGVAGGLEEEDSFLSGFDTNVVVFQRVIALPNAPRVKRQALGL